MSPPPAVTHPRFSPFHPPRYYSNSVRKEVQEENPDAKITDIAKLVGKRWALCSEADKVPFEALAAADKKRYLAEKEAEA